MNRRALNGDHNQCAGCGQYFNSSNAFDKHRTGEHAGGNRRCLTADEMTARGMALNKTGWWVGSLRYEDGPSNPSCVDSGDDSGSVDTDVVPW